MSIYKNVKGCSYEHEQPFWYASSRLIDSSGNKAKASREDHRDELSFILSITYIFIPIFLAISANICGS